MSNARHRRAALLLFAAAGCSNSSPQAVNAPALVSPITVAPMSVIAGQPVMINCLVVDEKGVQHASPADAKPIVAFVPDSSVMTDKKGVVTAVRAGTVEARCGYPSLGLVDAKGASFTIAPAAATVLQTALDKAQVTAGDTLNATCDAFDAYGNAVESAKPTVAITPTAAGNSVNGFAATLAHAGLFDVACTLAGATGPAAQVEVLPSLPAKIVVSKVPDQMLYTVGQVVELSAFVTDQYGNTVGAAPVSFESAPAATASFGANRFRYLDEGTYTVTAQVAQPTQGGADLTANVTVVVGGVGPTITCDGPSNGSMVNAAPGTLVVFTGTVSDPNGVTMVTVNGQPAPLAGGSYAATVTASYGINAVDIVADDTDGSESTRTCWFLAADNWAPEGAPFNDTVSLSLTQPAFDDGDRSGSINDFADVLQTVIDSPGLQQTLDATMRARNPLKPEGCDSQSCVFGICACNYSSGVDYLGSSLPGPNSVTLTLIDGGLAGGVVLQNVAIDLHVYGDVGPVPYDTSGTVTFDHIGVSLALDVALVNGQPQVSLRPNSVSTDVGNISTNFGGLDGWIINNIVVPLAQGSLRSAVASQLQSAISNNVDSIVGGLLSNLNVATLGTTFNVPKLDGSGTIPLSFGVGISTVDVNPARALFGLSTAFSAPPAQAFPALGVAIPDGPQLLDPAISAPDTAAATVHLAVLNQALDALWRGGMFDGALGGAALGGSQGASVAITSLLPPVADLPADGSLGVVLELGALSLEVTYPGLFGGTDANGNALPTLHVDLGATATATVALSGNALQVGSLTISQLEVSTGDLSIAGATKAAIQNLMTNLVTAYANQALTQALPALPIPSFPLPQALAQYGLPAGGQLGVVSPSLGIAPVHFVLSGQLGIW